MIFPNIDQIATQNVITVSKHDNLQTALSLMNTHGIRDVVVQHLDSNDYGILTTKDIIRARTNNVSLQTSIYDIGYHTVPVVGKDANILEVLRYFFADNAYLIVLDENKKLFGIVSQTDVISHIDPRSLVNQQQLGHILNKHIIKTADQNISLAEIFSLMNDADDAIVITDDEEPVGILTTRDAIRILDSDIDTSDPAQLHMTSPLDTVGEDLTIAEAMEYLKQKHFKRIIVASSDGKLIGMVNQRDLIDMAHAKWADMLRNHAAELNELVQLLEEKTNKLNKIAKTDTLTNCYNRYKIDKALISEINRINRYDSTEFSAAFIDIDYFKEINDNHGHLWGDKTLQKIVHIIQKNTRNIDLLGRWGGDEFMLLMPNSLLDDSFHEAERIRKIIATENFEKVGSITVSIGVAEYIKGETEKAFLSRMDKALYDAKLQGRNCVVKTEILENAAD